jgi:hypothetical protein
MSVLRMTEAELARDLHAVLKKLRLGDEVIVEQDEKPLVKLRGGPPQCAGRTVQEVLDRLRDATGVMDPDFARDVQAVINMREPVDMSRWD